MHLPREMTAQQAVFIAHAVQGFRTPLQRMLSLAYLSSGPEVQSISGTLSISVFVDSTGCRATGPLAWQSVGQLATCERRTTLNWGIFRIVDALGG